MYVIIKHLYLVPFTFLTVFPGGSDSQESACNVGDSQESACNQSLGQEDSLVKKIATHSNILAWRIHRQGSLADYSPWGHKD